MQKYNCDFSLCAFISIVLAVSRYITLSPSVARRHDTILQLHMLGSSSAHDCAEHAHDRESIR
jgi:hypothetical protein